MNANGINNTPPGVLGGNKSGVTGVSLSAGAPNAPSIVRLSDKRKKSMHTTIRRMLTTSTDCNQHLTKLLGAVPTCNRHAVPHSDCEACRIFKENCAEVLNILWEELLFQTIQESTSDGTEASTNYTIDLRVHPETFINLFITRCKEETKSLCSASEEAQKADDYGDRIDILARFLFQFIQNSETRGFNAEYLHYFATLVSKLIKRLVDMDRPSTVSEANKLLKRSSRSLEKHGVILSDIFCLDICKEDGSSGDQRVNTNNTTQSDLTPDRKSQNSAISILSDDVVFDPLGSSSETPKADASVKTTKIPFKEKQRIGSKWIRCLTYGEEFEQFAGMVKEIRDEGIKDNDGLSRYISRTNNFPSDELTKRILEFDLDAVTGTLEELMVLKHSICHPSNLDLFAADNFERELAAQGDVTSEHERVVKKQLETVNGYFIPVLKLLKRGMKRGNTTPIHVLKGKEKKGQKQKEIAAAVNSLALRHSSNRDSSGQGASGGVSSSDSTSRGGMSQRGSSTRGFTPRASRPPYRSR